MSIFESNRERITTGLALAGTVLLIGFIDNFYLMWFTMGAIYILAFREAAKLFEVENDSLLTYAAGLWLLTLVYPYGDDLFVLAGLAYASAVAFNKDLEWKNFFPFIRSLSTRNASCVTAWLLKMLVEPVLAS